MLILAFHSRMPGKGVALEEDPLSDSWLSQKAMALTLMNSVASLGIPFSSRDELPGAAVRFAKVLLVDDQPSIIFMTSTYLELLGISCDVARNGAEAVEKVASGKFSLMLTDLQMPIMDGLEATRRIRNREKSEQLLHLPIIGMTAFAFKGDRQRCIEAGMDDFLTKPFEPADLKSKVLAFIGNG